MSDAPWQITLADVVLDDRERSAVDRVLRDGWLSMGPVTERFEAAFAGYLDGGHAVAVTNGTAALHLAAAALGIGPGDEVICPTLTFVATAAAILHAGAEVKLADSTSLDDFSIDPAEVDRLVTPRTKAVIVVHYGGFPVDMDAIRSVAERHGLLVIEDAAQSIGSMFQGRKSGSFGHFGCFSAHPLKNLNAMGDAGFVTTNDAAAAARMRRLRTHGMADRETVEEWGFVSRMDVLQAAILDYRLDKLPDVIAKRRENAALYQRLIKHEKVFVPPCRQDEFNTFHTFVIQAERRDELQQHLRAIGIKTAIHYPVPIHLQPAAAGLGYRRGDFPTTERQAERILTLPVNQYMSARDVEAVAGEVLAFYGG